MANNTIVVKDLDEFMQRIVENGYTYRQLAKLVGVSQTTIGLIVKGERNPSPNIAANICTALNCQFEDIFLLKKFTTVNK